MLAGLSRFVLVALPVIFAVLIGGYLVSSYALMEPVPVARTLPALGDDVPAGDVSGIVVSGHEAMRDPAAIPSNSKPRVAAHTVSEPVDEPAPVAASSARATPVQRAAQPRERPHPPKVEPKIDAGTETVAAVSPRRSVPEMLATMPPVDHTVARPAELPRAEPPRAVARERDHARSFGTTPDALRERLGPVASANAPADPQGQPEQRPGLLGRFFTEIRSVLPGGSR